MRCHLFITLALIFPAHGAEPKPAFAKALKASLSFQEGVMPNVWRHDIAKSIDVYLTLENIHDSRVQWITDSVFWMETDLLDSEGKSVTAPATAASILSGPELYGVPLGSTLRWKISHGGAMPMAKNVKDFYLLEVGGTPWLVPIDKAGSYSLRIRLFGIPWAHADRWMSERDNSRELLLEIPATKLDIRKP